MPPFGPRPSDTDLRRLAILASRLTGWGKGDVLALTVEETEAWIADGVEVEKLFTHP